VRSTGLRHWRPQSLDRCSPGRHDDAGRSCPRHLPSRIAYRVPALPQITRYDTTRPLRMRSAANCLHDAELPASRRHPARIWLTPHPPRHSTLPPRYRSAPTPHATHAIEYATGPAGGRATQQRPGGGTGSAIATTTACTPLRVLRKPLHNKEGLKCTTVHTSCPSSRNPLHNEGSSSFHPSAASALQLTSGQAKCDFATLLARCLLSLSAQGCEVCKRLHNFVQLNAQIVQSLAQPAGDPGSTRQHLTCRNS
jgi:hypothetical protein